jgi:hypothetical protein
VHNSSKVEMVPGNVNTSYRKQKRSFFNDTQTAVSDFGQMFKNSVVEEVSDVKNTIKHEMDKMSRMGIWNTNGSNHYEVTANFDKEKHKIIASEVIIYDFLQAGLTCYDCYTYGELDVKIEMRGNLAKVNYYKITMHGNIKSNIDMKILFRQLREIALPNIYQRPFMKTVFEVSILPVNVPGVFALIPSFRLEAGLTEGIIGEVAMRVGFDFDVPLDIEILAEKGMMSIPKVRKLSPRKSVSKVHKIKDATTAGRTWIALMIRPQICWGFSVNPLHYGANFQPGMFMSLFIEHALGVQLTVGSWTHCPSENMNVELYQDHQFSLIILTPLLWKIWRFWRYKESFSCWFCDKECGIPVKTSVPFNNTASKHIAVDLDQGIKALHS